MKNTPLVVLCLSPFLFGFDYFDGRIDWNRDQNIKKQTAPVSQSPPTGTPTPQKFNWAEQLDPNGDEILKEGNYTPPKPFMEVIRNPNDENMKNWFKYLNLKNELISRMQRRMQEYLQKNNQLPPETKTAVHDLSENLPPPSFPESNRFRFRIYVDSTCPHCKRMLSTMRELQNDGFFVEVRQTDSGNLKSLAPTFPITQASSGELSAKDISSVPVLFAADLKTARVYRMAGYQTKEAIFSALSKRLTNQ